MTDNSFAKGQALWNPFGKKKKGSRSDEDSKGMSKGKKRGGYKARKNPKGRVSKGKTYSKTTSDLGKKQTTSKTADRPSNQLQNRPATEKKKKP